MSYSDEPNREADETNPFRTPSLGEHDAVSKLSESVVQRQIQVAKAFVEFEWCRILYNLVLTFFVGLAVLGGGQNRWSLQGLGVLLMGCFIANACYSVGTIIHVYAAMWGFRSKWLLFFMLAAGTTLAVMLALLVISSSPVI